MDCLKKAVRQVDGYEIETATRDAQGSPDIASTILGKIDTSELFLADVSIVNPGADSRECPNPNVMYELGYAVKVVGDSNIILIANLDTTEPANLPFDIRNRRMILTKFNSDNKKSIIEDLRTALNNAALSQANPEVPEVKIVSSHVQWASNWSRYGTGFMFEIEVDNYGGEVDYIAGLVLTGTSDTGNKWVADQFTFTEMKQNEPLKIPPDEIVRKNVFVTDDPTSKKTTPGIDRDTLKLEVNFKSGKHQVLDISPNQISRP